ncbi:hypothetical protein V1477_013156 [Vespula maculifrons]|uniref:Uncharacterized protein n=1 Tax=Vespula maculifrons TaxID=7453 RepID=A0ABD2BV43_VESMC
MCELSNARLKARWTIAWPGRTFARVSRAYVRTLCRVFRSLLYERVSSRNDAVTVQLRSELTTDTMALLFAVIVILVTTAMSLPPVIRIDKLYQQLTLEQSKTLEKELDTVEDRKNGVGSNR